MQGINFVNWVKSFFDDYYAPKNHLTFDDVYPIGSIYTSTDSTDPRELFGGYWKQINDKFLLAAGTTYSAGSTGGAASVTLTSAQTGIPAHGHGMAHTHNHRHEQQGQYSSGSGSSSAYTTTASRKANDWYTEYDATASSKSTTDTNFKIGDVTYSSYDATEAHNNMPPYMGVYMWKRIMGFAPTLTGTDSITAFCSNSVTQSDGVVSGRGAVFTDGWENVTNWQCDFEVKFDNQRYAGICFWKPVDASINTSNGCDTETTTPAIRPFEGAWQANISSLPSGYTQTYTNDTNYATYGSGAIDWFDVHIRKEGNTLTIWSNDKNKTATVTSDYLSVPERVTCGGVANHNDCNNYGKTFIRNLTVY